MAILNDRDYRLAKARRTRLEKAVGSGMSIDQLATNLSNDAIVARKSALEHEYEKINDEIEAYEKLQSGQSPSLHELDATDLGLLPIVGRIKRRLSQRQLATLLGVKEQQIQRYESERYAGIGLKRFEEVLGVLNIKISARLEDSQEPSADPIQEGISIELSPKVAKEIRRRQWVLATPENQKQDVEISQYVRRGLQLIGHDPHYRRALIDDDRFDFSALVAWQARIASEAQLDRAKLQAKFDFANMNWLSQLVALSRFDDGPRLAIEFLATKGIVLVVEQHLQSTFLDGAAFLLPDRTPVIGLTLRHDRVDNFWFTLMHELGHIFLHYNKGLERGFLDDLDVGGQTDLEKEADSFARSALIPDKIWNTAPARFSKSVELALSFAETCGIHAAIVVGRIQYERKDFKLFRNWLGQGTIRKLFFSEQ